MMGTPLLSDVLKAQPATRKGSKKKQRSVAYVMIMKKINDLEAALADIKRVVEETIE
jgi:hypothetical protein